MKNLLFCSIFSSFLPCIASAAVIVGKDFQTNGTETLSHTYMVSSTDLINGLTPTASTGTFTNESSGGLPTLTNGSFPSPITRGAAGGFNRSGFATGGNSGGTSVTYTLASASDIGMINVYGGWQDQGRDQQSYTVLYALAATPTVFTTLQIVTFNPTGVGAFPVATRTTISQDDGIGILAANVIALRFDFNTTENGFSGYSEIDVLAVPEPSTALLGCLGLLGLAFRRRR